MGKPKCKLCGERHWSRERCKVIPAKGGGGPEVDGGQTDVACATIASASPRRAKPQGQRDTQSQVVTAGETAPSYSELIAKHEARKAYMRAYMKDRRAAAKEGKS